MPSKCKFEFDRPDPVYYSGEIIKARISLSTTKSKDVRSVYIEFNGKAKVHWEENKTRTVDGKSESYTEHYRAEEVYLNQRNTVFSGNTLRDGVHTYTIKIPLPISCPTSCTEKYGHIRYELSLIIDRPYRFDNEFHRPITVIKQLNLNLSPEHAIPLKGEDIKYFCCLCCSSGPVVTTLTIPFGGYAPGQKIRYKLELNNKSAKYDLDGFKLKFKQKYKFVANTPRHATRIHRNTLASTGQDIECLRLTKRVIEDELTIPPVSPTSNDCSIITVNYALEMTIDCGVCHNDSEILIPITIGTVPLIQSARDPSHVASIQPAHPPTAPNMTPDDIDSDKPPSYEFYKPPSFEESTTVGEKFIDRDVNEHSRVEDFIPKYPMYTNFAVPSAPPPTYDEPASTDSINEPLLTEKPKKIELSSNSKSSSSNMLPYPSYIMPSGSTSVPPYMPNSNASGSMPPSTSNTSTTGYGWSN